MSIVFEILDWHVKHAFPLVFLMAFWAVIILFILEVLK